MSEIIAATDFSDIAENAVRYACNLAKACDATVTVAHSFIIPVAFSDTPMPVMPVDEGREIAEEKMTALLEKLQAEFPQLPITGKVMYGDIVDSLQEYTEENSSPWLIVLGNSDVDDDSAIWLGSTVLNALKNLPYPVMAVPPGVSYKPVNKICFTCDVKHITNELPSQQLLGLVEETKAALHVLTIGHDDKGFSPDTVMENEELRMYLSSAKPEYHFVDSKDVDTAIQNFVEENQADWLVAIPHKHSFFEGIFHKGHVKAMIRMTHIPLVALHDK
ncbi:MAG: hypothetical protein BGO69_08565 [Bacteroidetes bacterium 46-16]|nr:MAG: hypothetical protein BGO69_08565 [Bacteroidetes bacterium 46-16]